MKLNKENALIKDQSLEVIGAEALKGVSSVLNMILLDFLDFSGIRVQLTSLKEIYYVIIKLLYTIFQSHRSELHCRVI